MSTPQVKSLSIEDTLVDDKTAFYLVKVVTDSETYSVKKRYSAFEDLRSQLTNRYGMLVPSDATLPPKKLKLFTSHTSKEFIEQRRVLLEAFLRKIIAVPRLLSSGVLNTFLTLDKTNQKFDNGESKKEEEPLEDAEVTHVTIPTTRLMKDHILYQVDVKNVHKRKSFSTWTVLKRFNRFYEIDGKIRKTFAERKDVLDKLPPLPARKVKLLTDHMDSTFAEQRRLLLQNYLQKMIRVEEVIRDNDFLTFLGVP